MATRLVTRHYDRALAPVGLSTNGYSILARLGRLGPLPLGALAARLGIDRSTLSREIAPLVAAGLVEARPATRPPPRVLVAHRGPAGSACGRASALGEAQDGSPRLRRRPHRELVVELNALVGADA